MSTPIDGARRTWSSRALVVAVTLACLGSLVGAATAGAHTPDAESVGRLGGTNANLDYSKDQSGRLRPLSPDFIAQNLGLSLGSSAPGVGIAAPSGFGINGPTAVAAGPPINPVSTPVLPCVNGHQTADPLSPPCVSQFTGDNGGATYRGVDRNEVRVVVRIAGGHPDPTAPADVAQGPTESLIDLAKPPADVREYYWTTKLRLWQEYFNRHYQLYGRRVHLFAYYDNSFDSAYYFDQAGIALGAEHMRRAALDTLLSASPFAVTQAPIQDGDAYLDTLVRAGVVAFDPFDFNSSVRYKQAGDSMWGYEPTAERLANLFATYVCRKAAHEPTALSGNAGDNGRPRRFGVVFPDELQNPVYGYLHSIVESQLQSCGTNIVAQAAFPGLACNDNGVAGPAVGDPLHDPVQDRIADLRRFQAARVTTVLWLGCEDGYYGSAATALHYSPEWIILGDDVLDGGSYFVSNTGLSTVFDHHAIAVTPKGLLPALGSSYCYAAQREVDPSLPASPAQESFIDDLAPYSTPVDSVQKEEGVACALYTALRQVFTALQLAGPRLTPSSLEAGLRSLPYLPTPNPQTPSCFYGSGSTCVQDAIAEIWDGSADCWRAIEGGRRYAPETWPTGNLNAQLRGEEPCNYAVHG
ncbi:MAG: hypothetical protein JO086_17865 [Acidimicrobiia bacterium]|nr:hypothetical protein [Acidimicrobiia bacterium]